MHQPTRDQIVLLLDQQLRPQRIITPGRDFLQCRTATSAGPSIRSTIPFRWAMA